RGSAFRLGVLLGVGYVIGLAPLPVPRGPRPGLQDRAAPAERSVTVRRSPVGLHFGPPHLAAVPALTAEADAPGDEERGHTALLSPSGQTAVNGPRRLRAAVSVVRTREALSSASSACANEIRSRATSSGATPNFAS